MFERIQADGTIPKVAAVSAGQRADLAVAPAPAAAELREKAVAAASHGQRTSSDKDQPVIHIIGEVRREMDIISAAESQNVVLDDVYGKLFRAYHAQAKGELRGEVKAEADKALEELEGFELRLPGAGSANQPVEPSENAAELALRQQRERTLDKIDLALRKVGVLRSKLASTSADAYDRLVNINPSIAGLNIARTQVDDSAFSIESASSAVDAVMTNVRSMVTAHGSISPEIVRLILN